MKRQRNKSQHIHTPKSAPMPTATNRATCGATPPRARANISALNPEAANQSETEPRSIRAHWLGSGSRRKSWIPITTSIPKMLPRKIIGISLHSIGGRAAAPASNAEGPDRRPIISIPTTIQYLGFIRTNVSSGFSIPEVSHLSKPVLPPKCRLPSSLLHQESWSSWCQ